MNQIERACHIILVVDDQVDNRDLLNMFLSSLGYGVIEASNGLEALKLAMGDRPDLIIMDLSMPVMDGFNAVRILREMPSTSTVPVVACTAHDSATYKVQALSVGFDEVLIKPIDFTQLQCVVEQFLKAA
jgi:two-component system, cell cycle response regulator DivK